MLLCFLQLQMEDYCPLSKTVFVLTSDFSGLQVEYYFSDENLPTDKYMQNIMKKNKEGFGK